MHMTERTHGIHPDGAMCLRAVSMSYRRGSETIPIFDKFDLDIPGNDFVALMGPSGSGKTTLLNILGGLVRPSQGSVTIGPDDIVRMSQRDLTRWRAQRLGFVFQFYNLMPVLSAAENVELALLLRKMPNSERRDRVATALSVVGLLDRAKHRPSELSGGQQQRVAIARAIVSDPSIILADEPTGDLDRTSADEVLNLLQLLQHELGKTIVMVTHDPEAAGHAKRVLQLDKGRFVERLEEAA